KVSDLKPTAQILATAGQDSGDGGYIELSAKDQVIFDGHMDAAGYHGATGTILIDPTDIIINNTSGTTTDAAGNNEDVGSGTCASGASGTCNLKASDVQAFANNLYLIATHDITISRNFAMSNANSYVKLWADNNITVSNNITTSGTGYIELWA